jgi:hypothetical protein
VIQLGRLEQEEAVMREQSKRMLRRRPALNSRLTARVSLDINALPARRDLVDWLELADSVAERIARQAP